MGTIFAVRTCAELVHKKRLRVWRYSGGNNSHNLHNREAIKQQGEGHNSPVITDKAGRGAFRGWKSSEGRADREKGTEDRQLYWFPLSLLARSWRREWFEGAKARQGVFKVNNTSKETMNVLPFLARPLGPKLPCRTVTKHSNDIVCSGDRLMYLMQSMKAGDEH